jgi:hypothetical protein
MFCEDPTASIVRRATRNTEQQGECCQEQAAYTQSRCRGANSTAGKRKTKGILCSPNADVIALFPFRATMTATAQLGEKEELATVTGFF